MGNILTVLASSFIAFVATNLDDIIILLLFFSQVDHNFRHRHIVGGQYLGFIALLIASLPGFFGGLVVPREWIGLLGLLPIAIGIKQLISPEEEETEVQSVTQEFQSTSSQNAILSFLFSIFSPQTYKVAAVTIANGGDNISIYIPLFAGSNLISLMITVGVFLVMVGVWCAIAYFLIRQRAIALLLDRYGKPLIPFIFIGLGLFILYERGTFIKVFNYIVS